MRARVIQDGLFGSLLALTRHILGYKLPGYAFFSYLFVVLVKKKLCAFEL